MVLLKKQNETINPSLHQLSLVPRGRVGQKPKNGVVSYWQEKYCHARRYRTPTRIEGSLLNVMALIACHWKRSKELGERIR